MAQDAAKRTGGIPPFNLNDIRPTFPYADFFGTKLHRVKAYMVNSRFAPPVPSRFKTLNDYKRAYNKWSDTTARKYETQVIGRYSRELIRHLFDTEFQKKGAKEILNIRSRLEKDAVWPKGLKGMVGEDRMIKWMVDNFALTVPEDHLSYIKSQSGKMLYESYKRQRRRGWKALPEKEVVDRINRAIDRVEGIGIRSEALRAMVDLARSLPAHRNKPGGLKPSWPKHMGPPPEWSLIC